MSNELDWLTGTGGEKDSDNALQLFTQLNDAFQAMKVDLERSLKQLLDLKLALDESSIVAVTDPKGAIRYVNDKFCEVSGYSREELIGKDHRIINSGYHSRDFMQNLWTTIRSGRVWKGELKNKSKNGSYYWVNTTIVPFLGEDGAPYQYLAIRNEVTELKRIEEELQLMMTKMIRVQEEERKRLSRELHDGIGQSLFSLLIQIETMKAGPDAVQGLDKLRKAVTGIIEDIRSLSWELRPSVLDDLGVVPAIRTYLQNYSRHYGIDAKLECSLSGRLDIQTETTIYRIIQEALTNTAKYADVSEAEVTITEDGSFVLAMIRDTGRGFDPTARTKGVGLFSMEERARSVGGELDIASSPGAGTTVTLKVPTHPQ